MSTNKKISEFDIITTMAEGAEIPVIQGSPKQNARISQKNFTKDIGLDAVKNKVDNLEIAVADDKLKITSVAKTYQTEALALADKNPVDPTTALPLTVGQFVSIVDDATTAKNGIYRIGSFLGDGTMVLELQGKLGDLSGYANHGYESNPKTLKEIDDFVSQLADSKIGQWTAKEYIAGQLVLEDGQMWEAVVNTTSAQEPGIAPETIWKPVINIYETQQYHGASALSVLNHYVRHADGMIVENAEFNCTDFIAVEPNITYTFSLLTATSPGCAFYDSDKKYISGFGSNISPSQVTTVTTPSNARYVRLSNRKTNTTPYFKTDGRYNIQKILNIVEAFKPRSQLEQQPVLDTSFSIAGSFVNYATGAVITQARYNRTDYIKVEPNISFDTLFVSSGDAGAAWYDEDKKYISGFKANTEVTVTSPSNARYIMLSVLNTNLTQAYFKPPVERLNIDKVLSIVNAFPSKVLSKNVLVDDTTLDSVLEDLNNKESADTVVISKEQLNTLQPNGLSDRAYPIGKRVYDHSLRREVIADGSFWRLPDGRPASLEPRVYVYPDWDEIRTALPTYAKAYNKVFDAKTLNGWNKVEPTDAQTIFKQTNEKGFDSICIENSGGASSYVYFNNGAAINLNSYLIFKAAIDWTSAFQFLVGLFDSTGTLLFYRLLQNGDMGTNPRDFYTEDTIDIIRAELKVSNMTPAFSGASLSDVAGVGFRIGRSAGSTAKAWIGELETVSFKPMITLRFDDQRASVYTNAMPIMQQYGFNGLIAVITGAPELANDPNAHYPLVGMTKENCLEVRSLGWDLVSHTHTHPQYEQQTDEYMREDYRKSVAYLRSELNAGDIASSCLISPYGRRNERIAQVQREFFDCQINGNHINSHMLRQPEGTWKTGSLWTSIGSSDGDKISDSNILIGYAQRAIEQERWLTIMFHDILPTVENSNTTTIAAFTEFCAWLDANRNDIEVVTVGDVVRKIRPEV